MATEFCSYCRYNEYDLAMRKWQRKIKSSRVQSEDWKEGDRNIYKM